jgi:hypothetical protein
MVEECSHEWRGRGAHEASEDSSMLICLLCHAHVHDLIHDSWLL